MTHHRLTHQFVEQVPVPLEEGFLYVSMEYATAIHKCACGCGEEVVTPISPTDWTLLFDGDTVSLDPSIGNWNFECRSHYWIRRGVIRWAADMSQEAIEHGRSHDRQNKESYFKERKLPSHSQSEVLLEQDQLANLVQPNVPRVRSGFWASVKTWLVR